MSRHALVNRTAGVVAAIAVVFAMGVGSVTQGRSGSTTTATDYNVDMESGWMTVNETNEIVRLDFQCQTGDTELVNLMIFGTSAPAKVDVTKNVAHGDYFAIAYDPSSTGRFRARAAEPAPVSHPSSFCRASFELISTANGQQHMKAVLDLHNIYPGG